MLTDPSSRAGSDLFRYISSASKPKKAKHQHQHQQQQQQQGQQSGLLDHLRPPMTPSLSPPDTKHYSFNSILDIPSGME